MAHAGHKLDRFRWKRLTSNKTKVPKVQLNDDDISQWVKRVELASELAVSEVFPRPRTVANKRINSQALILQSMDQLQDHNEAYCEAQVLLSDWMNKKLRLELEVGEDDITSVTDSSLAPTPAYLQHENFDDLYSYLDQEAENSVVHNILQELMDMEVMDCGIVEDLMLDSERQKRRRDPVVSMELRQQLVRASRARRDAERLRLQQEREQRRAAREEVQRREQEQQRRRRQEVRQQEELLQQEVVRLRREMKEQKSLEQRIRLRYCNHAPHNQTTPKSDHAPHNQTTPKSDHASHSKATLTECDRCLTHREKWDRSTLGQIPPSHDMGPSLAHSQQLQAQQEQEKQRRLQLEQVEQKRLRRLQLEQVEQERLHRLQLVLARVHMLNLQCVQRHFSAWYSVVLERRVQLGKAAALCDWRAQLRAWRGWRSLLWARRAESEAKRTEEELRSENRRCQMALESDRRRLLRHCLRGWRVWSQVEQSRRALLAQQEDMQRRMSALISAATSSNLETSSNLSASSPNETTPSQPQQTIESSVCAPPLPVPDKAPPLPLPDKAPPLPVPDKAPPPPVPDKAPAPPVPDKAPPLPVPDKAPPPPTLDKAPPLPVPHKAPPTQAWQVTRQHAGLIEKQAQELGQGEGSTPRGRGTDAEPSIPWRSLREEIRRTNQQRSMAEQRRRLIEQRQQITQLLEEQRMLGQRTLAQRSTHRPPAKPRSTLPKAAAPKISLPPQSCPLISAMEERARQRAERRRELEERKRRKEEEKETLMREEMEHRQKEEEEQRKREAERRKEERRQKRERELEKQRRVEREQQLQVRAAEHHRRALLLHHGLAPWKRLLEKGHAHIQLAQDHHRVWLLRHCLLSWMQAAVESQAEKEACADRLYQHTLLRRSLHCWHSLLGHAVALEMQAERFCRIQTLRRTLRALLDHVTQEKFAAWDREEQARQHWHTCVVRRCLWAWQRLPSLLREEQEREVRREQLRRRVAEILPDFRCSAARGAWGLSPP